MVLTDRAQQLADLGVLVDLGVLSQSRCGHDSLDSDSSSDSSASSSDEDSETSGSDKDPVREICELHTIAQSIRYFEDRGKFLKSKEFARDFFNHLPDAYFRHMTRMNKHSFWTLVRLIEGQRRFRNKSPREQMPVSLQLAVTLDRLGHYGNGAALKRSGILWGVSTGSVVKFMHRCLRALEVALVDAVIWPDARERARISSEFAKKGFPGCVGLVDGTLLFLSQRPKIDGETYFDRKRRYSINMQVICDDRRKILHIFTGLPGSCADSHCIQSSPFWRFRDDERTFSAGEYLVADSAYGGLKHIVAGFKNISTRNRPDREDFNLCVAKTRVVNEHCIGVLKSRWHSLKEIKTQLKGPPTSVWAIRQIECCIRLHNFVMDQQDDWQEDEEVVAEPGEEVETLVSGTDEAIDVDKVRERVMAVCLSINRCPGGFLA